MRTLLTGGPVLAPGSPTAVLIDGERIAWLGPADDAGTVPRDRVVELDGAVVTPGFVDAHVHLTATGLAITGLDLRAATSAADLLDRLAAFARTDPSPVLLGSGWDETRWADRRVPTSDQIDRATGGRTAYLARVDAHGALVSGDLRPDPADRRTPLVRAEHHAARERALGSMSAAQTRAAQRAARHRAAALGIVAVHEMAGPQISGAADLRALLELAAAEPGPLVTGYWGELHGVGTARELGAAGAAGDLFCDGSLGSHTAALHRPYSDAPTTVGALNHDTAELVEHVLACDRAGLQAGFHAIGDAAVDQVLDAVELAARRSGAAGRLPGRRHRIEHAEMVTDPARLARSGLTASVQPMFDALWGGRGGMYADRLGAARAAGLNRFADLHAAGVPLAFGSDSPVTELGPWAAVRAAVHPHEPGAGLSARQAFAAHTVAGWRAAGLTGGRLEPGAPADLAVWTGLALDDTDRRAGTGAPVVLPDGQLPRCVRTVVRGRTVHAG